MEEEDNRWISIEAFFFPYEYIFNPYDIGEFLLGLFSAMPINLFLGISLASLAAMTANSFLGWDFYLIYNLVFGFISVVSLGRYFVELTI